MNETEVELVRRARDGDRPAFEELVRRTSRLVYAKLYLDTGDTHRAEDLLQETFLLAFRSLRGLADPAGFRAWLLAIAHNALIDAARRDTRQKRLAPQATLLRLTDAPAAGPSPDEVVAQGERRGKVLAALRSLPEEYRLPLTLRYVGGDGYDAIGEQLGLSNGALRGLLHRGLKLLRNRLPAEFAEPG